MKLASSVGAFAAIAVASGVAEVAAPSQPAPIVEVELVAETGIGLPTEKPNLPKAPEEPRSPLPAPPTDRGR